MISLEQCLAPVAPHTVATLLHVGAVDSTLLRRYAQLAPQRLILACPEPDPAAAQAAGLPAASMRWLDELPMPAEATAHWMRYNVPGADGVLPPARLREVFPRLAALASRTVKGMALDTLLRRELPNPPDAEHRNLLVINLPGVEARLLEEAAPALLARAHWIALRGAAEGLLEGGDAAERAPARLQPLHFRIACRIDSEPLWPSCLLALDEVAHGAAEHAREAAALRAELAQARQRADVAEAARRQAEDLAQERQQQWVAAQQAGERHLLQIGEQQARIDALAGDKAQAERQEAACRGELAQAKQRVAELTQALAERDATLAEQAKGRTESDQRINELKQRVEQVGQTRDEQSRLAAERQAQLTQLNQEKVAADKRAEELTRQLEHVTQARDEQARLATERLAQVNKLTQDKALVEKVAGERKTAADTLATEKSALVAARDQHAKAAGEAQRRAAQLESELNELAARQALLQEELVKAEAQVELIADLLLREPRP